MRSVSRPGTAPRAAARLGASIVCLLACLAAACTGSGEKPTFSHSLGDLSRADRIEVSVAGVTPVATITDPAKVEAIITFVERYRDGWTDVWSGAGSERIVTLYSGTKAL